MIGCALRLAPVLGFAVALGLAGCVGEGSDIGPDLPKLPGSQFRVLVKDDAGRGVVNAGVSVDGLGGPRITTGRAGRADLFAAPTGRSVLRVAADGATAAAADRLGSLALAFDAQPATNLPFVVYLPDLSGSVGASVQAGTLPGTLTLDDSATSGAALELPAGTTVGLGGPTAGELRTGALSPDRIPPLVLPSRAPALVGRGAAIDPPAATFAPGGTLTLPNDLGLAAGATADLFRLDPADGEWRAAGAGQVDATGATIRSGAGALAGGGLYAFGIAAPRTTVVTGHVLSRPSTVRTAQELGGVRVRAGQVFALADGNGRFVLAGVPAVDAQGTARDVRLTVAGGPSQLPLVEDRDVVPAPDGVVELGDLETDIDNAVDLRVLLIERGVPVAMRAFGLGSASAGAGASQVLDGEGRASFPALTNGYLGFLSTVLDPRASDPGDLLSSEGILFAESGIADARLFYDRTPWTSGGAESALVWTVDARSTSYLHGVLVYRLVGGVDQFVVQTNAQQIDRREIRGDDTVAALETAAGDRRVFSAFAAQSLGVGRIEMPLSRAPVSRGGEFEPFGLGVGAVPGAGAEKRARATGLVTAEVWLDAVLAGRSLDAEAPVVTDPGVAGGAAFAVGVPARGGAIGALSGVVVAGALRIDDVSFAADLRLDAGRSVPVDLGAPAPCDQDFTAVGAAVGRDPAIPVAAFVTDYAIETASGAVVDVARGAGGNARLQGDDVVFRLPALAGRLAGARHLVLWRGAADGIGVRRGQALYVPIDQLGPPAGPRALLGVPTITAPTPGAMVSITGFDVTFELPSGADYAVVHLRREDGGVVRDWRTLVRADSTSVRIRQLPAGAAQVLAPGRYVLEVEAARIGDAVLRSGELDSYQYIASRFVGISPIERGVQATASMRIEIELVP